ncbi:MAG: ATP-dependent helicase, partial [Lachnospiraceae bacterium]|nr:ATP-dependent helicase [Lachnospiraceae bacterium]
MEKQINDAQKRAILHDAGPMLVLAGPGSGKTFVITNRIKHLTHELGISGDQILVISFSRASALEMKDRYLQLTGDLSTPVSFGTFHAVFFQILKNEYHLSTSDLLSFKEKRDILRESLQQAMYDCKSDDDLLLGLMEWKDKLEHTEDDPEDALSILLELFGKEKNLGGCLAGEELPVSPKIYETLRDHYEDIVRKRKKLDFDDMLVRCRDLFRARPVVLRKYQAQYRYILIDEFQDINPIQFEVIRMLAKPENNLFVVGDDDQAIYSFRGSSPEIMLHFKEYYPLAKQVILNVNYRCAGNILEVAAALIRENKNRFAKDPEA